MRASRRAPILTASGLMLQPLAYGRTYAAAAADSDNILIAGGMSDSGASITPTVERYDAALVRGLVTSLVAGRSGLAGVSNSAYKLFGGGYESTGLSARVDAYSSDMVRSSPTALVVPRALPSACSNGAQLAFGGGVRATGNASTVDGYNIALTRVSPSGLSQARSSLAAASNDIHMIFAGGEADSGAVATVDAYSETFTRIIPSPLALARVEPRAAKIGGYALFAGDLYDATIEVYDEALSHTLIANGLSAARQLPEAISAPAFALFSGYNGRNYVDAIDATLTKRIAPALLHPRTRSAGAANSKYALFGGGTNQTDYTTNGLDAYNMNLEHFATA